MCISSEFRHRSPVESLPAEYLRQNVANITRRLDRPTKRCGQIRSEIWLSLTSSGSIQADWGINWPCRCCFDRSCSPSQSCAVVQIQHLQSSTSVAQGLSHRKLLWKAWVIPPGSLPKSVFLLGRIFLCRLTNGLFML